MQKVILIGDVHCKASTYIQICKTCEYEGYDTIQLGDLGFARTYDAVKKELSAAKHRFIGGNHDAYNCMPPHSLGDFGTFEFNEKKVMFVRGAFSIDKDRRTIGLDWFPEEELNAKQRREAKILYKEYKPDIMLTHECPRSVGNMVGSAWILERFGFNPDTFTTNTSDMLQEMLEFHQPKNWYYGHFHRTWQAEVRGCKFRCLNELETCFL